jgi:septin 6/8/11
MQELQANGVEIYQFPVDDESVSEVNGSMNSHIPFAVVGSTDLVKIGNKTVRARQYPWGTVQGNSPLTLYSPFHRYTSNFIVS